MSIKVNPELKVLYAMCHDVKAALGNMARLADITINMIEHF